MSYDAHFEGSFTITPPLTANEVDWLIRFRKTRHCACRTGPYQVVPSGDSPALSHLHDGTCNSAETHSPGLWCEWVPSDDGTQLRRSSAEWSSEDELWLAWLIQRVFSGDGVAEVWPHQISGTVKVSGADGDQWSIMVRGGEVVHQETVTDENGENPRVAETVIT